MIRALILTVLIFLMALPAYAQDEDIKGVIGNQITAFQTDDFETAFTYASPSIRQMFVTPQQFGTMVRNGYPMVHRPQSYVFQELRQEGGRNYQDVLIEGRDGLYYMAEYDMVLTDAGWKIRGVRIFRIEGVGA